MNILAIGAHYDDVELGCGGALIKHAQRGDTVSILTMTDSAYSAPDGTVIRCADVAASEGREAARILGANLMCLGIKTFQVTPCDSTITQVYDIITAKKIDTLYCHWTGDVHYDHHSTARIALMAARHVPRILMYRSNFYDSSETFRGNFYIDISDVFEQKITAIKAHLSELERVQWRWIDFFRHQNGNDGQKIGVNYAEAFEVVRYLL